MWEVCVRDSIGIVSTVSATAPVGSYVVHRTTRPRELRDAVGIFLCATLRCAAGFISREIVTPSDGSEFLLPPLEEGVSIER